MQRRNKGFTLVELIIVIAVIGVLAAILIPIFSNVIKKANSKSALADARNAVSVYVTESMDRRAHGDTSCPSMITIIIQKAGKWFVYGFDTSVSNSIMSANSNDNGGLEASSFTDLVNRYSWNGLHPGVDYNPNVDQTTLDSYTVEDDGAFYLQTYNTDGSAHNPNMRGFVGTTERYLRLDEEVTESDGTKYGLNLDLAGNSDDRAIFAGCLVGSAYTLIANEDGTTPSTDVPVTSYTVTYDVNLPAGVTATLAGGGDVQTSYTVQANAEHLIQGNLVASNSDYTFDGWKINGTGAVQTGNVTVTSNINFVASWTQLQRYNITITDSWYDGENDNHVDISGVPAEFTGLVWANAPETTVINTVIENLTATLNPDIPGMHFESWQVRFEGEAATPYDSSASTTLRANLTISPVFGPIAYEIHFLDNNNQDVENPVRTRTYGQSVGTFPTAPTVSGKVFLGWTYEADGLDYSSWPNPVSTSMTFRAHYGDYVVTFYDTDGSELTAGHSGNTYTIPQYTLTTGYHFTGWTVSTGDPCGAPGETFTATSNNITVTATEAVNQITVIYTDGHTTGYEGGTAGVIDTQTVNYGNDATAPAAPTWGNHYFNGWSEAGTSITGGHNSTKVIWATWDDPVTVTLVKNTTADVEYTDDSAFVASVELTKYSSFIVKNLKSYTEGTTEYTFNGWKNAGNETVSGSITVDHDITLTADWTVLTYYTITIADEWIDTNNVHHPVDITNVPSGFGFSGLTATHVVEQTVVNGVFADELTATLNPAISGMKFEGWLLDYGTGSPVAYNSGVTNYLSGNLTIRPVFGPIDYTVTFYDGSSVVLQKTDYHWGDTVVFPADQADKGAGQHFKGWKLNNAGEPMKSYPNPVQGGLEFYAAYGPFEFHIYDVDGSDITTTPTGDTYPVPAENTLTIAAGRHFAGWTVYPSGTVSGSTFTPSADGMYISATDALNYYNVYYTDGHTTGYDSTSAPQGIISGPQSVAHGGNATPPADPANYDATHSFNRWSSDGHGITAANHGDNVIIYAIWNDPITITYDPAVPSGITAVNTDDSAFVATYTTSNGGSHVVAQGLKTFTYNNASYVFDGWYIGSAVQSGVINNITADITLTAHWETFSYVTLTLETSYQDLNSQNRTVTYTNTNGFTGSPLTREELETASLNDIIDGIVVDETSLANGMRFQGWQYKKGTGSYLAYDSGTSLLVGNAAVSIKPVIGPRDYTITFIDGSTTVSTKTDAHWGDSVVFPSTPADGGAGQHFKYWALDGDATGQYTNSYPNPINGNMTFRTVRGAYEVTFYNTNGQPLSTTIVSGDTYNIPRSSVTISAGYRFAGWTVSAGAACPETGTYTATSNGVTITATEEPDTYTWTFQPGAGSGSNYSMTVNAGSYPTLPTTAAACGFTAPAGKELKDWVETVSTDDYAPGANTLQATSDLTFVARWKTATYTWTFQPHGGTGSNYSMSVTHGSYPTLPTVGTEITGWTAPSGQTFQDWIETSSLDNYAAGSNTLQATSNLTFDARWQAAPSAYTITYTTGAGTDKVISDVAPGSTHNVLTIEEAALKVGASKTGILYWECSNGTNYSPAGNYVASAGSSTATATSLNDMAHSVTVNSNLTFTAHTITSSGTSDNTELYTFTFTPANGAGGTRTFLTGFKYRAASAGYTFEDPSVFGITAPTGKSFDHWEMTYRDYSDGLPSTKTFAVGATLATQRDFFFIPVYTDAPAGVQANITFYDAFNEENCGTTTATITPGQQLTLANITAGGGTLPTYVTVNSGTAPTVSAAGNYTVNVERHNTAVSGDSGTDYVVVTTLAGLRKIGGEVSGSVNDSLAATNMARNYWLNADINWGSTTRNPIGWTSGDDVYFSGKFVGNGHTVSGVQFVDPNVSSGASAGNVGMFAGNEGTIKNVKVTVAKLQAAMDVGGICGDNEGTIEDCIVDVTNQIYADQGEVGGIAGANRDGGIIRNCQVITSNYKTSNIVGGADAYVGYTGEGGTSYTGAFCGGIVGNNYRNARVEKCSVNGLGLCTANAGYSGCGNYIGGIAGFNDKTGTISECWSFSNKFNRAITSISNATSVAGFQFIGGIVGGNVGTTTNSWCRGWQITCYGNTGGVCGRNYSGGTVSYCWGYASGGVWPSNTGYSCTQLGISDMIGSQQGTATRNYIWDYMWATTGGTNKSTLSNQAISGLTGWSTSTWYQHSNGPMLKNNTYRTKTLGDTGVYSG